MDVHTHLTFQSSDDWNRDELDALKKTVAERTLDTLEYARKTLMTGFTTVRDVGSSDLIDIGLRNAIRAGKVAGRGHFHRALEVGLCLAGDLS